MYEIYFLDKKKKFFILDKPCNWNYGHYFCYMPKPGLIEMTSTRKSGKHRTWLIKDFDLWFKSHCIVLKDMNPTGNWHRAKWTKEFINQRFKEDNCPWQLEE